MPTNDDILRRKRELHQRIARLRQRIDGRLRATRDEVRQLLSWQTYVARYPVWAMAAAAGAGMTASTLLRPVALCLARPLADAASVRRIPAAALERTATVLDQLDSQ